MPWMKKSSGKNLFHPLFVDSEHPLKTNIFPNTLFIDDSKSFIEISIVSKTRSVDSRSKEKGVSTL